MMDFDNKRLAERLKAALDEQALANAAVQAAAEQAVAEGAAGRALLLDGLAGFAVAIGHIEVERTGGGGVLLRRGVTGLSFEPETEGSGVRVAWDRAPHRLHRLTRESQLAGRWVWEEAFAGRTERRPFDERALEDLLSRALDLPRVGAGDPERPMSPRTAKALLNREPRTPLPTAAPVEAKAEATDPQVAPDGTRRRRL